MIKFTIKIVATVCCLIFLQHTACAQTASPKVKYIDTTSEAGDSIVMSPSDSQTGQAPLEFFCTSGLDTPEGWSATCEWKIYETQKGVESPLLTRYEESTSYTLTASGSYSIQLFVTFTDNSDGSTIEVTPDPFIIVISESELKCPNTFTPNGDGKNDVLRISCKSIVKLNAQIFNRWGQRIASKSISNKNGGYTENGTYYIDIWDGRNGGSYAKDGVYFLNLYAEGSDGRTYKEKKAINLLKGFNEESENNQ